MKAAIILSRNEHLLVAMYGKQSEVIRGFNTSVLFKQLNL